MKLANNSERTLAGIGLVVASAMAYNECASEMLAS
jgi:hypothetical protein